MTAATALACAVCGRDDESDVVLPHKSGAPLCRRCLRDVHNPDDPACKRVPNRGNGVPKGELVSLPPPSDSGFCIRCRPDVPGATKTPCSSCAAPKRGAMPPREGNGTPKRGTTPKRVPPRDNQETPRDNNGSKGSVSSSMPVVVSKNVSRNSLGGNHLEPDDVAKATGERAVDLLAFLGLPAEGEAGPCPNHGEPCEATVTREATGALVLKCSARTTLAEVWLHRRQGLGVREDDAVSSLPRLAERCCYAILGHELGWVDLDVQPLDLPDGTGKTASAVAEAFALWEAARATCGALEENGAVVLSERLWAALARQRDRKSWRLGRNWLIDRGVLEAAEPYRPDRPKARPISTYRRAGA